LRLKITDPSGLGLKTKIEISSSANEYRSTLASDDAGNATAKNLPFGVYRITVQQPGFATASQTVEIRSALPQNYTIKLTYGHSMRTATTALPRSRISIAIGGLIPDPCTMSPRTNPALEDP